MFFSIRNVGCAGNVLWVFDRRNELANPRLFCPWVERPRAKNTGYESTARTLWGTLLMSR
jgi:hypothetical protein